MAELNPDAYRSLRGGFHILVDNMAADELIEATLNAIYEVAPLDQLFIVSVIYDSVLDYLYPESCGWPIEWDEWDEMVEEPASYQESVGLYVFVTALRLDESDVLMGASEHWGWNLMAVDLDDNSVLDWERFAQLLDKNGLGCFKNAFDACAYQTGNPYFDYNPNDEETQPDLPPFMLEGVRTLQKYWQEAQPILADYQQAEEMFEQDRSLAGKILKLVMECREKRERVRVRTNLTLAEVWGEEPERVIDPFYGPLDGIDDDDEEEE